jgi:hypothetical protein
VCCGPEANSGSAAPTTLASGRMRLRNKTGSPVWNCQTLSVPVPVSTRIRPRLQDRLQHRRSEKQHIGEFRHLPNEHYGESDVSPTPSGERLRSECGHPSQSASLIGFSRPILLETLVWMYLLRIDSPGTETPRS